jgi:hypothetical protein
MTRSRLFYEPLTRHRHYTTAPRTWTPGEVVNASMMNSIRALFVEIEAGTARIDNVWSLKGVTGVAASGSFASLFTTTSVVGMYWVRAGLGSNDATNYAAYAHVFTEGGAPRIVANNRPLMQIQLSGAVVQAAQFSGVTAPIKWVTLRIA